MRIYFTSCTPAVLKLNGEFAGNVDLFERYTEVNLSESKLAEIVPGDNLQQVNFFIDDKLLCGPPDFLDVYLGEGEAMVHVKRFESRSAKISVVLQTRFEGNLVTVFSQGETYLSVEGDGYELSALGPRFGGARAEPRSIGGNPVLAIFGEGALVILNQNGKKIFCGPAESADFGQRLTVAVKLATCTAAEAVCGYACEGGELTLVSARISEKFEPPPEIMHFAFFESLLIGADVKKYLSAGLQAKAGELRGYLGSYAGVVAPTEKFRAAHPGELAAGLVYPKTENLAEIKYFAVSLSAGKIDNIYPL